MGGGGGMAGGRGMGMGQEGFSRSAVQQQGVNSLQEEARILEKQLADVKRRIDSGMGKGGTVARVDAQECNGCGVCIDYCSFGAITVNGVASIDANKCTACGTCVDSCPLAAITIM